MILIVGGTFQGKKAFAEKLLNEKREDFTDGTSCAFSDIYHAKVLFHFHPDALDKGCLAHRLYDPRGT